MSDRLLSFSSALFFSRRTGSRTCSIEGAGQVVKGEVARQSAGQTPESRCRAQGKLQDDNAEPKVQDKSAEQSARHMQQTNLVDLLSARILGVSTSNACHQDELLDSLCCCCFDDVDVALAVYSGILGGATKSGDDSINFFNTCLESR